MRRIGPMRSWRERPSAATLPRSTSSCAATYAPPCLSLGNIRAASKMPRTSSRMRSIGRYARWPITTIDARSVRGRRHRAGHRGARTDAASVPPTLRHRRLHQHRGRADARHGRSNGAHSSPPCPQAATRQLGPSARYAFLMADVPRSQLPQPQNANTRPPAVPSTLKIKLSASEAFTEVARPRTQCGANGELPTSGRRARD